MIASEFYKERKDGVYLYRTFSDTGYRIRQIQTGIIYDEAIDTEHSGYVYEETNEPIEEEQRELGGEE